MPGWLEGSVGLRDVLVAGNTFANGAEGFANVTVGQGTRNISVDGVPSVYLMAPQFGDAVLN
jgi:hypothetical protein